MLQANVVDGVHRIEDTYVNWFLLEEGKKFTAVDAGLPVSPRSLNQALAARGASLRDLEAIVLTHAHFDHVGFAERARVELGVPVWVHSDEVELASHPLRYGKERNPLLYAATHPAALPILLSFARAGALRSKPIEQVLTFDDGETLDVPGSPKVVFTPGHTFGHVALDLPDRGTVIAGDALVTLNPYTAKRGPQIVSRAATVDSDQALRSLDRLVATGAQTVLPGHGEPWTEGVEAAVERAREVGAT